MYVATNMYGWTQLAAEDGRAFDRSRAMAEAKEAGFDGWEDTFRAPGDAETVVAAARQAGLEMRSAYIPGGYADERSATAATQNTLRVAEELRGRFRQRPVAVFQVLLFPRRDPCRTEVSEPHACPSHHGRG